jgi:hypothetical protein
MDQDPTLLPVMDLTLPDERDTTPFDFHPCMSVAENVTVLYRPLTVFMDQDPTLLPVMDLTSLDDRAGSGTMNDHA